MAVSYQGKVVDVNTLSMFFLYHTKLVPSQAEGGWEEEGGLEGWGRGEGEGHKEISLAPSTSQIKRAVQ